MTADPDPAMPGEDVRFTTFGFPPDTEVALLISVNDEPDREIGVVRTDGDGIATVVSSLPPTLPFGVVDISARTDDGRCFAGIWLAIVGSREGIRVDDDTVTPGQRILVTASGFEPGGRVTVVLDGDAFDLLSTGRVLEGAEADRSGIADIAVEIPGGVAVGRHFLTANGDSFDGLNDLFVAVDITVVAGALPPTDTEPGG